MTGNVESLLDQNALVGGHLMVAGQLHNVGYVDIRNQSCLRRQS